MKIYISGPITGVKDYQKRFKKAAETLAKRHPSATIINPAGVEGGLITGKPLTYDEYMEMDLSFLDGCDAIYFLPGWKQSRGFNIEYGWARATQKIILEE